MQWVSLYPVHCRRLTDLSRLIESCCIRCIKWGCSMADWPSLPMLLDKPCVWIRTETVQFMKRWCVWREAMKRCCTLTCSPREISERHIPEIWHMLPLDIQKLNWSRSARNCFRILIRIPLILSPIMIIPWRNQRYFRLHFHRFWSMPMWELPFPWQAMSARLIWQKFAKPVLRWCEIRNMIFAPP